MLTFIIVISTINFIKQFAYGKGDKLYFQIKTTNFYFLILSIHFGVDDYVQAGKKSPDFLLPSYLINSLLVIMTMSII